MKKFLFINPFGIGDVLFTTPLLRSIKESSPDSFIGYWCNERVQGVLKNDKYIDKIFALSRGDIKKIFRKSKLQGIYKFVGLLRSLRKERFDASFDFSLDHRYGLISKIAGIKRRIGFNYKNRGVFLTDKIDINGYNDKHVVEHYLDLLQFIHIDPKKALGLAVSPLSKKKVEEALTAKGIAKSDLIVGMVPGAGASWGKHAAIKQWPRTKFARLADKLSSELGARIVLLGDESEKQISEGIISEMKNEAIDLTGKTTLEELAAVIQDLSLLITNDGGPLHMAVALGTKTVSLFGPVDERVYGPYPQAKNSVVVKKGLSCRPCYKNFKIPPCNKNRECIDSIGIEEVFIAAKSLLQK